MAIAKPGLGLREGNGYYKRGIGDGEANGYYKLGIGGWRG